MRVRLYNARIITMSPTYPEVIHGEILIDNGKIICICDYDKKDEGSACEGADAESDKSWDMEIDCKQDLLLPGFKNAHTHSAMTFLRSYADDLPLNNWLFDKVFPLEAKLSEEEEMLYARLGILEYLTSGITSNFDMYKHNICHAKVSKEMGFRTVLCGSINDFGGTVDDIEEEYLKLNSFDPLVSYKIGFHAEYTTGMELLKQLSDLAHKYKEPVCTHIAETKKEVDECYDRYHMSPFGILNSIGMFDYGGTGFHGVWLSQEDYQICKEKNVSIVSNPSSNLKLASGIADLVKYCQEGILVGLGTDGPASNNALDMFREMYLASVLPKVKNMDAAAMDSTEVLKMATTNGALIMGLDDCDMLEKGKRADIIRIGMSQPNMQPEHNLIKNLVYSGSKSNVVMTMVDGKILYDKDGFHVGFDVEELYEDARKSFERIENA